MRLPIAFGELYFTKAPTCLGLLIGPRLECGDLMFSRLLDVYADIVDGIFGCNWPREFIAVHLLLPLQPGGDATSPIYYSSFHFLFHYPNITPMGKP